MKTMIIPFYPVHEAKKNDENYFRTLCNGAWSFAHTVLWKEQVFTNDELYKAKQFIREYFELATDYRTAFIAFCERVILTSRYVSADPNRFVPSPSLWFNKNYEHGYIGTRNWLRRVKERRAQVPGYLKHLSTLAQFYYQYLQNPSETSFNQCREKLLEQNAFSLLQHFYNTIIHYNYIKQ
jgi:hypothetical protein